MARYGKYSGGRSYSRSGNSYRGSSTGRSSNRSSSSSRRTYGIGSRCTSYNKSSYRSTGNSSYGRSKSVSSYSTRYKNGYKQYNSGNGWKFTHRRVAEKKIGGRIRPGYEVHHINGNKRDNRPRNLTVISRWIHRLIHRN